MLLEHVHHVLLVLRVDEILLFGQHFAQLKYDTEDKHVASVDIRVFDARSLHVRVHAVGRTICARVHTSVQRRHLVHRRLLHSVRL